MASRSSSVKLVADAAHLKLSAKGCAPSMANAPSVVTVAAFASIGNRWNFWNVVSMESPSIRVADAPAARMSGQLILTTMD